MDQSSQKKRCVIVNHMRVAAAWLVILAVLVAIPARPARGDVDAASVQRSIDRGIAYLRKSQTGRGGWPEYGGQSCGLSSLCVLALLTSGVPADDPQIVEAMRYLRSFEPNETYSVSLQTLVYCQLGSAGDLPRIRRNVKWLVDQQKTNGGEDRVGAWDYGNGRGSGDPSNAQFALLALGAAEERGVEVESSVFERSLDYWTKRQRSNGGWVYTSSGSPTGSMTCAGIASIIIAGGHLGGTDARLDGDSITCCGEADQAGDRIAQGLDWLGKNFTLQVNPGGESWTFFYYLYALERVGRLSGRRFIGDHDWYREGAERLLALQDEFQGFWTGVGAAENNRDVATSFALLFLSKGKRQVVVGRLDHSSVTGGQPADAGDWNRHPDSLRQLVRHVERDWRRDLTWQTISAQQASLEDLLQSPVLVIGGRQPLRFSPELTQRLADYLDQGGCIVFDDDASDGCGDANAFRASVERVCAQWFPDARLEPLPPDHPVWFAEHRVDPDQLAKENWVSGIQACCRTPVFYSPRSLSCRWSLGDRLFRRSDKPEPVRNEIETAIRLGENIIAYATGRELKDKLDQRSIVRGSEAGETQRGVLQLAGLALDAGGEQARRALPNAAALIRERVPMQVAAAPDDIRLDDESLRDVGVLWIHGRTSFALTPAQRESLSTFIERGGIVIANAICASDSFATSFRDEMQRIVPGGKLELMSSDHSAWTTTLGGFDVRRVTIRTPDRTGDAQTIRRQVSAPRIESMVVNDVASVFFSPLDLSCALESQNSIQCQGYGTDEAVKIVANLMLYALQQ